MTLYSPPIPHISLPIGEQSEERRISRNLLSHGVTAFVGPTGSGKTLLAVHFAIAHAGTTCGHAHKRGEPPCELAWHVLTNMTSDLCRSWSDLYIEMPDLNALAQQQHTLILMDEGHMNMDSRLSTSRQNRAVTRAISQTRKRHAKLYVTSQTFGKLDLRVRGEAKTVYSPWNEDQEGDLVKAVVHHLADGARPPGYRTPRPYARAWYTGETRHRYETEEVIDDTSLVPLGDRRLGVVTPDGSMGSAPLSAVISGELAAAVSEAALPAKLRGESHIYINDDQIAERVTAMYRARPKVGAGEVSTIMTRMGYEALADGYYFPLLEEAA